MCKLGIGLFQRRPGYITDSQDQQGGGENEGKEGKLWVLDHLQRTG